MKPLTGLPSRERCDQPKPTYYSPIMRGKKGNVK